MNLTEKHYSAQLTASEYDFLEVVESTYDGRIQIKFLDTRWRSKEETIAVLKEIITHLDKL